jgi:hypothetical protein
MMWLPPSDEFHKSYSISGNDFNQSKIKNTGLSDLMKACSKFKALHDSQTRAANGGEFNTLKTAPDLTKTLYFTHSPCFT